MTNLELVMSNTTGSWYAGCLRDHKSIRSAEKYLHRIGGIVDIKWSKEIIY